MGLKINIISNYLYPERGAAANRITQMAKELSRNHDVEVTAPLPNYPTGKIFKAYNKRFFKKETIENFLGRRYWSYNSISGNPLKRAFAMLSFGLIMIFEGFHWFRRKPDVFIVQNSPLLVSMFGIVYAKFFTKAKIVLNVSDLWPLSALELGAMKRGKFYSLLEMVEEYNYRNSDMIIGQSEEILTHVKKKCPGKKYFLYRNIPQLNVKLTEKVMKQPLKVVYAGLLGVAQGVYDICCNIDFEKTKIQFDIYGEGNELEKIKEVSERSKNINYRGSLGVKEIRKALKDYDFAIVPLKNRIYGAVPSKIFELTLLGVPIIFCGGGEGAEIVEEKGLGYTCSPGDFNTLQLILEKAANIEPELYQNIILNCNNASKSAFNFDEQMLLLEKELNVLV